jgi:hypothetical protein
VISGVIYGISIDSSMATGNYPFGFLLRAFRADDGGRPSDMATGLTLLKSELVVFASVPERLYIGI